MSQRPRTIGDGRPRLIGEEAVVAPASPLMNLAAAVLLAAIAVVAVVLGVKLPNPGDLSSHPGLLPVLVGASLLAMALGLGVGAVRDGALRDLASRRPRDGAGWRPSEEGRRTATLVAIIVAYVVLLDRIAFEIGATVGSVELRIGSFECVSVPVLAVILRLFWKRSWTRCAAVAAAVVLALAAIFRYVFVILLPGS